MSIIIDRRLNDRKKSSVNRERFIRLGAELGWDDARRAREVSAFQDEARAEGILPAP